jgi:short-subunit dehydrogenase
MLSPLDPTGAVCLVTGASSGIGRATANALASAGARLVLVGRDRERLEEAATATRGHAVVSDLGHTGEPGRVAAEAEAQFGRVDVLVNNAGLGLAGSLVDSPPHRLEELVAVNLLAPVVLTRALLPGMLERRAGAIVNVASVAGHVGVGGEAVYAATKAALVTLSTSLQQELADTPVRVSVVSPGVIATPFFERRGVPYTRRWPRPIPPERVAEAIVEAIRKGSPSVFVPGWMTVPARLQSALPGVYRMLASRWG